MRSISKESLNAAIVLGHAAPDKELNPPMGRRGFSPNARKPRAAFGGLLGRRPEGRQSLSVWATLRNGHAKMLTIDWLGEAVAY